MTANYTPVNLEALSKPVEKANKKEMKLDIVLLVIAIITAIVLVFVLFLSIQKKSTDTGFDSSHYLPQTIISINKN